jgi:hypothetical protein
MVSDDELIDAVDDNLTLDHKFVESTSRFGGKTIVFCIHCGVMPKERRATMECLRRVLTVDDE